MLSVRQEIVNHRLAGYSYKEIKRKLGVTEDQIKYAVRLADIQRVKKSEIFREIVLKYKKEGYDNQTISEAVGLSKRTVVGIKNTL